MKRNKQVTLNVTEVVEYEVAVAVPEGIDMTDEMADELWCEHGDPIKHFTAVTDRTVSWNARR